jgi:hypothetical protein
MDRAARRGRSAILKGMDVVWILLIVAAVIAINQLTGG